MENRIELLIASQYINPGNNQSDSTSTVYWTQGGAIDLYPDEPINLKFSINDVRDISKGKTTITNTFAAPSNKNNDKLFNHIYQIGSDSTFNPAKKVFVYMLVNGTDVIEGNLQLLKVNTVEGKCYNYEFIIYSETSDFIKANEGKYLTDLYYGDLNHKWSYSNIINSWSLPVGTGYTYPIIDYGYDWELSEINGANNNNLGVRTMQMFPAIFEREITSRMFSAAGYTWTSTILDSAHYKRNVIPYNGNLNLTNDISFVTGRTFLAHITTGITLSLPTGNTSVYSSGNLFLQPGIDTPLPNFDNGNLFTTASFTYSSDTNSVQQFALSLDYFISGGTGGQTQINVTFYRGANGNIGFGGTTLAYPLIGTRTQHYFTSPVLNSTININERPLEPGEQVRASVQFSWTNNSSLTPPLLSTNVFNVYSANTYFYNIVSPAVVSGQTISYNQFIPRQVKLVDFWNSVRMRYNLYVEPSRNNRNNLIVENRDDYYAMGATKDWTNKLKSEEKILQQLLSEQNDKKITFTYKQDKDYLNEYYTNATNRVFGDYIYDVDNDFTTNERKIELIFSPTPTTNIINTAKFIVPKIGKLSSSNVFGKTDFNIRLLQVSTGGTVNCETGEDWKLEGNTQTKYPFASHLNHPFTGDTDLNFGQILLADYDIGTLTDSNLVNNWWKKYLDEINDKNSRLVTCMVDLSAVDINQFRFNDNIFIDGITNDGGHYFRVNSIEYPAGGGFSTVELILIKNKVVTKTPRAIPGSGNSGIPLFTGTGGGIGTMSPGTGIIGGPSNFIGTESSGSFVYGRNNTINSGNKNSGILGGENNSIAPGITGSTIIGGSFISATTNNTLFTQNIQLSSGSTINGVSISTITASTLNGGIWTAATGANSIILNNFSANIADATSTFCLIAGRSNSALTTSTVIYGSILGGRNNLIS